MGLILDARGNLHYTQSLLSLCLLSTLGEDVDKPNLCCLVGDFFSVDDLSWLGGRLEDESLFSRAQTLTQFI